MGLNAYQKAKILTLTILLLIMALFSAQSHAAPESKLQLIERLQEWKEQIQLRTDLDLREKDLEIEFVSRLIFQTESKYREQELQVFMQKTLTDMQETDDLGSFLENLNEGLSILLEKNEDVLSFMQAFLEFSRIQEPATAAQFAETRSYYDGRNMMQAQAMSLNDAAEYVDEKERQATQFKSDWVATPESLTEEYKDFNLETPPTPESSEDPMAFESTEL